MSKPFRVQVFGKAGCDKCRTLNQRLDKLLATEEWSQFDKQYCDVETEEGMLAFCRTECVNPQHIPAMVVLRRTEESGDYELVPNPRPGKKDKLCKRSRLYQYQGLRTDYSAEGKGLLTPRMIASVLSAASK